LGLVIVVGGPLGGVALPATADAGAPAPAAGRGTVVEQRQTSPSGPQPAAVRTTAVQWGRWVSGLTKPTHVLAAPGDTRRTFVTEAVGRVRVIRGRTLRRGAYLNIADRISTAGEGGLLSMAFHPQWQRTPLFWISYVARDGDLVVARGRASRPRAPRADVRTLRTVLRLPHPLYTNHYGGHLAFGPDGLLYVGTGDGGGSGDPLDQARDPESLWGKILRINVTRCAVAYCIPRGNPFVGVAGRNEIWLLGARNPWRFSFHRSALWVADVGQAAREEVTRVPSQPSAIDLGWPCREGDVAYDPARCVARPRLQPRISIAHDTAESVTGGVVVPRQYPRATRGAYLLGDFVNGRVWAYRDGRLTLQQQRLGSVRYAGPTSFGYGPRREVLAVTWDGRLWRLRA
jgi:hypothetical protein